MVMQRYIIIIIIISYCYWFLTGFQFQMFDDWWAFTKLGLYGMMMLCLESWAYEISVLLSGKF